eukprot:5524847-Amphidinium_carterae.1
MVHTRNTHEQSLIPISTIWLFHTCNAVKTYIGTSKEQNCRGTGHCRIEVDSNLAKSLFCSAIVLNAIFIGVDASTPFSGAVHTLHLSHHV